MEGDCYASVKVKSCIIGATTLSRMNFSLYAGHETIFSWMSSMTCCLVVRLGLGFRVRIRFSVMLISGCFMRIYIAFIVIVLHICTQCSFCAGVHTSCSTCSTHTASYRQRVFTGSTLCRCSYRALRHSTESQIQSYTSFAAPPSCTHYGVVLCVIS